MSASDAPADRDADAWTLTVGLFEAAQILHGASRLIEAVDAFLKGMHAGGRTSGPTPMPPPGLRWSLLGALATAEHRAYGAERDGRRFFRNEPAPPLRRAVACAALALVSVDDIGRHDLRRLLIAPLIGLDQLGRQRLLYSCRGRVEFYASLVDGSAEGAAKTHADALSSLAAATALVHGAFDQLDAEQDAETGGDA